MKHSTISLQTIQLISILFTSLLCLEAGYNNKTELNNCIETVQAIKYRSLSN